VRDEALHDVRKAAKRLRYAAEAVAPRFGERAVALAEDMAELQDVLGLHHDEAVARTAVWRFAHERADDRGDGSVVRILRDLDDQKAADVGAYRRVWKRLRAGQARPWPA
jgi:CHAD domain-containing protein